MPIPNARNRTSQLARCAGVESIRLPFPDSMLPRLHLDSNRRVCCGFLNQRRKWRPMPWVGNAIVIGFAMVLGGWQACAGEFDSILRWRNIGPYRGGRTHAV